MSFFKFVLFEFLATFSSGLIYIFRPDFGVVPFLTAENQKLVNPLVLYAAQWFGAMVLMSSFQLLRSLRYHDEHACRLMTETFLFGDFVYVAVFVPFIQTLGEWNIASIFAAGITVFLAAGRSYYLFFRGPKAKLL